VGILGDDVEGFMSMDSELACRLRLACWARRELTKQRVNKAEARAAIYRLYL
jgi:hypothetical protein